MVGENLDQNAPVAGSGTEPITEPAPPVEPAGTKETPPEGEEDYSFDRWQKEKGYKTPDDLGKAYGNADKHIKTVEAENAKFREYIQSSIPWIQYAEQKYEEESKGAKPVEGAPVTPPGTKPADPKATEPGITKDTIKEVASEMIGPQINKLSAEVSRANVKSILKTMRGDKDKFPYMNKETESEMNKVLMVTNKSFPISEDGIRELYNAAVGRRLPTILKGFETKVTEDISKNLEDRKSSFIESDHVGNAGSVKDAHKDIVDSIMNSSYGKSQV